LRLRALFFNFNFDYYFNLSKMSVSPENPLALRFIQYLDGSGVDITGPQTNWTQIYNLIDYAISDESNWDVASSTKKQCRTQLAKFISIRLKLGYPSPAIQPPINAFVNQSEEFFKYIDLELKTNTGGKPSDSTIKALLDFMLFYGAIWNHWLEVRETLNTSGRFPYSTFERKRASYDGRIQAKAFTEVAEVLPLTVIRQLIIRHTGPATRDRALLLLYVSFPMRDDAQFYVIKTRVPADGISYTLSLSYDHLNILVDASDGLFVHLNVSKTLGKQFSGRRQFKVPEANAQEIRAFLSVASCAFPFGIKKNSARIITLLKKLGISMKMVDAQGNVRFRNAGIDYLRRAWRAEYESRGELGEGAYDMAHTSTTSNKYRAVQVSTHKCSDPSDSPPNELQSDCEVQDLA
jgi:hypothetical protein